MSHKFLLIFLLLTIAIPVHAQYTGRVSGSVVDASGAGIPGAQVNLYLAGGSQPLLSTATTDGGLYTFLGVRPTEYDLTVEAPGFNKATVRKVVVDPARETPVAQIKLSVLSLSQNVEVTADAEAVGIGNAEISETITMQQVDKLPLLDRDPLEVIQTQAGVIANGNSPTVINGMRTSYSNMTLDGINIQDNYIRDNALDYSPNKILVGQVQEVTIVGSNSNSAAAGGASQVNFVIPSGGNTFHGEALWYNRNNYFSANDWFNNQSGVPRSFLNQNQGGGSLGGPIKRDKLFFYSNYELVRTRQQAPTTTAILTDTARQGIFKYVNSSGAPQQKNLLTARNTSISIDPYMQALLNQVPGQQFINSYTVGDSSPGNLMNFAGYRFNQRSNSDRDNVTGKVDYSLSSKNTFATSFSWNRFNSDRPDFENDYSVVPKVTNPTNAKFFSASWRWTPASRWTNELLGGFNLTYGAFPTSQKFGSFLVTGMLFSDPVNESLAQGRNTDTYELSDNAAYARGRHYLQFGFSAQKVRVRSYDDASGGAGIIPTYGLFMGAGQTALTPGDLPGISIDDLANANALMASLGGYIDNDSQVFNITSRASGFVPGATYLRHFRYSDYGLYVQDKWAIRPHVTSNFGLRYEIPGVPDEANSLELLPVIQGNPVQTLLSNATLDFAGSSIGKPWFTRSWKNFAPYIGLAWDVFGNGKTAVRGGYSINYVNDAAILASENMVEANPGLTGFAEGAGLSGQVSKNLPAILVPPYQVPITSSANYANDPNNTIGLIDPALRTPYVQQYSFGVEHEYKNTIFKIRYVGNHGVGEYRAFDFNQVDIQSNGFLADFLRAQSNGFIALKQLGRFLPSYNSNLQGSQPLTVFPKLSGGGFLRDPDFVNLIEQGQVGELASEYQVDGLNGQINFFQNPYALGADMLTGYSSSSYNSLQIQVTHRFKSGLDFQGNYTFSKNLSDGDGDIQTRFQNFLDFYNKRIERSRVDFDLTHMIKGTAVYDLPFGADHRLSYHPLQKLIGGWSVSPFMTWQSGAPFSILSGWGTLNRSTNGRSYYNTANAIAGGSQLADTVKFQMTPNGPYIIKKSAISPADGTGITAPGEDPFPGEVFFNPGAGNIGALQRRMFSGPSGFYLNAAVHKTIPIAEGQSLQIDAQALNVLNHTTFWPGDQNINSTTFGAIGGTLSTPRILQFGLRYRF